ncbi:MAG: 2Fe-2S iron-sulfur cluster binding domain-containing protein [Flavobacteriales bacterium]|nr:2Fe-2S iron-sulfur cluster binding domain-containing protein [Flavobacteriales bacterium]
MFSKLKVQEIKQETKDTVSIAFEIPEDLKAEYAYQSGQYITIKATVNDEDVRRAYSLCSSPSENEFRIGVKKVENGKMSTFLNENLSVGDKIEVMKPSGNFVINDLTSNIVAFAAGSGITPVLSMIKSTLKQGGTFTLFYGNKTSNDTIFKKELDSLSNEYSDNFKLHYIYSRENGENKIYEGRITKEKCNGLVKENLELLKSDGFYMCGPEEMIHGVSDSLKELGVNENKIHFELFTTPSQKEEAVNKVDSGFSGESQVTVIMDGDEFEFGLKSDGDFILDAAMSEGADVPFSCKGAVCCTCKAQVIEGKAIMELNYSLSDAEVEEGFILTCQSHPASEKLVVDYDVT